MKRSGLVAMIVLAMLPLATTGLAMLFVLPESIPLHAGVGGIDRMGPKSGAFEVAFILAGCGALATIAYTRMDKLAAKYDSDAHSGRVFFLFALALMNVWQLIFLVWMACGQV